MEANLIEVLDKGFVKLVDFMGSDLRVVNSARVSFGGVSKGEDKDKLLIKYLMEHDHHSPFEHCTFQFHIKCPIFVARQWMRHRISSYNEVSARYTEVKDEFYFPAEFRTQDTHNKQGSLKSSDLDNAALSKIYQESIEASYEAYQKLLAAGVAREMARGILPVAQYTQFYWTINARSLMNFIRLRADSHAQYEIRVYAEAIEKMFKEKLPWSYDAFAALNKK
ncbi:MAG: FAD-dependent thymidylate synthase [Elusimicrobiota bacterium]|jgi:thymidylate synthase (FAD)|nr:FAD-dependent thymidylate synthase [Elusimicrobiota bacterium]